LKLGAVDHVPPAWQALSASPAAEPTEEQKKLQGRAEDCLCQRRKRHQEMILPASTALQKRYKDEVKDLQQRQKKNWAQQLSFDVQKKAGRHVTVSDTLWVAHRAEREIITKAFEGATVYRTAQAMLGDAGDGKKKKPHRA